MMRREPCSVCGGTITAPADDWDAIRQAVRHHNASTAHREARRRRDKALATWFRRHRMTWDLDVLRERRRQSRYERLALQ